MTWLGWSFLTVMLWPALYITWDLHRMRKDVQAKVREINRTRDEAEELREQAQYLYEKAREIYADAAARWSSLVTMEGRIH